MCGIFGKFFFNKIRIDKEYYQKCLKAIQHRGPDNMGLYCDKNVILGSTRLSILDLSTAGQMPMTNEDCSLWIIFNGEIYNFRELRKNLEKRHHFRSKTDTETILHLYEEKGKECLKYLRGMFAFAIWDKKRKELFIARDRLGKKPIKYYYNNNFFIFASELKAILEDKSVPKDIDYDAIDEFLTYQYVPSPKTGFKNIFKLEPAHYIFINIKGEITKTRYWDIDFSKKLNLKEKEWEEMIISKLKESIKLRLVSDVPLGAHLSGGIDSSLILALMAEEINKPVKTFSIGFEESDYNELFYARLVAKRYSTDHHELIVKPSMIDVLPKIVYHYEEPYADPSAIPTWYLCKLSKESVTVVLNGDGGDENFAGYGTYNLLKLFRQFKKIPLKNILMKLNTILYQLTNQEIFRKGYNFFESLASTEEMFYLRLMDFFGQEDKDAIYTADFKEKVVRSRWQKFLKSKFNEARNLNWIDKISYVEIVSHLPDDLLVKVDIAGMAHSLEVRSPFLDHEFVELTAQMPSSLKMKGYNKKYLLKKIARNYLPQANIFRSKKGFVIPLEHWLKNKLRQQLKDRLLDKNFLSFGLFDKKSIEMMLNWQKQKILKNYSRHLWALMMLEEWLKLWF